MKTVLNFIGGKYLPAHSEIWIDNVNPATGKVYGQIPASDEKDVNAAVTAAREAAESWRLKSTGERSRLLREVARLIRENLDELAEAETIDTGKPISVSRTVDIPRSAANFEFFADACTQTKTDAFAMADHAINYTVRDPVGVTVCISPWNLPLYLFTWKIAPALAFGNTVVAKPSEVTPMTAFLLCQYFEKAGVPAGVFNVVHGHGEQVGKSLVTHPDVKAITFTGSTTTGKTIASQTAPLFKKLSLEMGGKNANIIFSDCDFEKAVGTTLKSSFANQGQICLCGSRVYVEKSIYEKFKTALVEKVKLLKQGDPLEDSIQQGAVVSKAHYDKVLNCIQRAQSEGGSILLGGKPFFAPGDNSSGYFIEPTIIENLNASSETNQQEIFGPVITLTPFESEDQVIDWANGTEYGLAGSIWTRDIDRAHRVARKIQSGLLWINTWMLRDLRTPFGGVKNSGMGREGGDEAYRFFTQLK